MNFQTIIKTIRQWLFEPQSSRGFYYRFEFDPDDITTYATTKDIFASDLFTPEERRREYIRRGKSPSGVIDGEYNDMYLEDGAIYNDMDRDWEADA